MVALRLAGRGDRVDLIIARVPFGGHPLDDAALARRVPAFQQDQAAFTVDDVGDLNLGEAKLERGESGVIVALIFRALFVIGKVDGHGRAS